MFIPLRHENMEGRRWPVISIALVLINLVAFLATHGQIDNQNPKDGEVRAHVLLLAAMHPELSMPPNVQAFVTNFQKKHPGTWKEVQNPNRDVADGWDARVRLMEDQTALQQEMDSLAEQFANAQQNSLLEQYAFVPAHPKAISYLTANFLHGGWLHLIGNMWFLWLAGAILEDTWGRVIYPIVYLVAGAADQIAVALLQGDHRPAHIREDFPEEHPLGIEPAARGGLIGVVEWRAVGDAAGFAVEPGKAPALAAEPADILVRIAPAGELPIEDAGELWPIQHVVAGAEIAVAQHRRQRLRQMRFDERAVPADHRLAF